MGIHNKPKVLSLFSGAGCFDIGFEAAGFQNVLSVDQDQDCCLTIEKNRNWTVVNTSIESIKSQEMIDLTQVRPKALELLIGGPPCQPFSKSAFGTVDKMLGFEDERASTVREYVRVVKAFLPKAFVIENVPQFITGKNTNLKEYLQRSIKKINTDFKTNYQLNFCKINAAWYGVPQIRERLFIIASREGLPFSMPEPRFFDKGDYALDLEPYRTSWDAIGHLSEKYRKEKSLNISGKWTHLLKTVPPGQNYLWHTKRGGGKSFFQWRSRYWNFLLKLHPNLPSWTIAAQPGQFTGPFHWDNRRLSIEEIQLLQTIPQKYKFAGSYTSMRKQIGNGIPSAIGELIGKEIRKQFYGEKITSSRLSLVPDKRKISKSNRSYSILNQTEL